MPTPSPAWGQTTHVLSIPQGDAYGALWVRYQPDDASEFLDSSVYGMTIDLSDMHPDAFVALAAYRIEGNEALWSSTLLSRGGNQASGVGVPARDDAGEVLFFLATHSPATASIRAATLLTFPPDLPDSNEAGTWFEQGVAELSFYSLRGYSIDQSGQPGPASSHGVTVEEMTPSSQLLSGPMMTIATHHSDERALQFSASLVLAQVGAGSAEITWATNGTEASAQSPFVWAGPASLVGGHIATGLYGGESTSQIRILGTEVLPSVQFNHLTIPFDFEALGFKVKERFGAFSPIPVSSSTWCMQGSDGLCLAG